jgi:predicted nucleic acid-binding protein
LNLSTIGIRVFILAWLKDEERPSGEMDGVREIIERSKRREVKIVTSVLTKVEVFDGKIPVGVESLFSGLLKRIHPLSMDIKIAQVAHDLRNYYSVNRAQFGRKILSTPDAIHLATAIIYRATEFILSTTMVMPSTLACSRCLVMLPATG